LNVFISWRTTIDSLLGNVAKEDKRKERRGDEGTGDDRHLARETTGSDMSNENGLQDDEDRQRHNSRNITTIERTEVRNECCNYRATNAFK
jgi:hypothetical protein